MSGASRKRRRDWRRTCRASTAAAERRETGATGAIALRATRRLRITDRGSIVKGNQEVANEKLRRQDRKGDRDGRARGAGLASGHGPRGIRPVVSRQARWALQAGH